MQHMRQNLAADLGIILPKVRVRGNIAARSGSIPRQDRRHRRGPGTIDRTARPPGGTIIANLNETVRQHADEAAHARCGQAPDRRITRQTSPATVDELIPRHDEEWARYSKSCNCSLPSGCPFASRNRTPETLGDHAPRTRDSAACLPSWSANGCADDLHAIP